MMDISNPYTDGDPEAIISEEDLPFIRLKPPPEEEDAQSIQTGACLSYEIKVADSSVFLVQAWVVDIPDPRHITTLLKYVPYHFANANSDFNPQMVKASWARWS
jgi:tRNA-specific adenosine deaminase 3